MVEESEPRRVHGPARVRVHLRIQRVAEAVGAEDVHPSVAHQGRRAGHRVEHALYTRADPLRRPATAGPSRRVLRTREIEEMSPLRVVQLKRAGKRLENAFRDSGKVAALEAGVVVDADPGEDGDLLPAQSRNAPIPAIGA
jgi:hypothetical protein